MLRLKKIMHSSLREKVREVLKQRIVNQELKPGARLKEDLIAKELGISRTPVREAIADLARDGLVEEISRKGSYVIKLSRKDVQEIYDIRKALECLAVRLAIPHLDDENLEEVKFALSEAEKKREEGKFSAFIEMDTRFHDKLVETCQNERLQKILNGIHNQIQMFRVWEAKRYPERVKVALEEHKAILDGLKIRNAEEAEKRMKEHIERVKQGILTDYPF